MPTFQNKRGVSQVRTSGDSNVGRFSFFGIVQSFKKIKDDEYAVIVALPGDINGPTSPVVKAEFDQDGNPTTTVEVFSVPSKDEPAVQAGPRGRASQPMGPNTIFDLMRGRRGAPPAKPGDWIMLDDTYQNEDGTFSTKYCYRIASEGDIKAGSVLPVVNVMASVLPEEGRWVTDPSGKGGHFEPTGRQFVILPNLEEARVVSNMDEFIQAVSEAVSIDGIPGQLGFIVRGWVKPSPEDKARIESGADGVRSADYFIVRAVKDGDTWRSPTPDEVIAKYIEGAERNGVRKELLNAIGKGEFGIEVIPIAAVGRSQFDVPSRNNKKKYDPSTTYYATINVVQEGERVWGEVYDTEMGRLALISGAPSFQPTIAVINVSESGNSYITHVTPAERRYSTPVPIEDLLTANLPPEHRLGIKKAQEERRKLRPLFFQARKQAQKNAPSTPAVEDEGPAPHM